MLAIAFVLDLVFGDPVYPFHPIRLMGKAIERGETYVRRLGMSDRWAGGGLAILFPLFVFLVVWLLIFMLAKVHMGFAWAASIFGIYSSISVGDLKKEGLRIYKDVQAGDIKKARQDLAGIVGRDTQALDQKGILRGAIETVAESTVDGIVAPLIYAALGGAPLALTYKAVNTLDSMIGRRNDRYRTFGYVAAKQDDWWNWFPARCSYWIIGFASLLAKHRAKEALRIGWQDGMAAHRGNSDIPESAFAGALGLELGGASTYEGCTVEKPILGSSEKDICPDDLVKSLHLMIVSAWSSLLLVLSVKYGIVFIIQN